MDPNESDSSPSSHSLLDRLKLEVCTDSKESASNKRRLTINAPIDRNYTYREQSHEIDKEITDLENLIKRLQVEINQMSISASKPLKDYVLQDNCNDAELKREIMTYPVLHTNISSNSGQESELDDVRKTFKMLWDDNISATTSDTPELNLINEQDEDKEDGNLINTDEVESNNLNIHILRDYIAAKKKEPINPPMLPLTPPPTLPRKFPVIETIANEFSENTSTIEIIPKVVISDEIKPKTLEFKSETLDEVNSKAPDDNKPPTSNEIKPDSTIRLGILMHIFGDRTMADKKRDVVKPLDTSSKPEIKLNLPKDLTDTVKSSLGTDDKTPQVDLQQSKDLSESKKNDTGSSIDTSNATNKEIIPPKSNDFNSSNPKILDKVTTDTTTNISKINFDDSRTNKKHRDKHLRRQDKLSDTLVKPCLADEHKDSTTNGATKNDDTSDLKKQNLRTKYPSSRVSKTKNISIKQSTEGFTKEDFKTLHEINKTYDSKADVPQRLSIINIYLDAKKPKSNIIIHKKPKGHGRTCSPSDALQNVVAKQISDANIGSFVDTNQNEDPCDSLKISKALSQDFKTPSNENSLTSEKIEVSETMKKAYQNKCLINASLRSVDPNPRINSNPKLLEHDLTKSVMGSISQSNKIGLNEINEVNNVNDTKVDDIKTDSKIQNNMPNENAKDYITVTVKIKDSNKTMQPENAPLTDRVSPIKPIQNIVTGLNNAVLTSTKDSPKSLENIVVNDNQMSAADHVQPCFKQGNIFTDSKKLSENASPLKSEEYIVTEPDKSSSPDILTPPETVEVIVIDTSEATSIDASLKQVPTAITKPTTPETSMAPSKDLISEISVKTSVIPEPKPEQSTNSSKDVSKQTSVEASIDTYQPVPAESVSSKQTETDLSYKNTEDLQHKITSTSVAVSENMSELTGNKSVESYETGDMTDEYESLADDNESLSEENMSNEPQILIQKTEITINNGDNYTDAVEDVQDVMREPSEDTRHPKRKK